MTQLKTDAAMFVVQINEAIDRRAAADAHLLCLLGELCGAFHAALRIPKDTACA